MLVPTGYAHVKLNGMKCIFSHLSLLVFGLRLPLKPDYGMTSLRSRFQDEVCLCSAFPEDLSALTVDTERNIFGN